VLLLTNSYIPSELGYENMEEDEQKQPEAYDTLRSLYSGLSFDMLKLEIGAISYNLDNIIEESDRNVNNIKTKLSSLVKMLKETNLEGVVESTEELPDEDEILGYNVKQLNDLYADISERYFPIVPAEKNAEPAEETYEPQISNEPQSVKDVISHIGNGAETLLQKVKDTASMLKDYLHRK
jgi:hypothetical protein